LCAWRDREGTLTSRQGRKESADVFQAHGYTNSPREENRLNTVLIYIGAALAEIAGCFGFWMWLRQGRTGWWLLPALLSLAAFAYLLTLVESNAAGRAYAAYGGVYMAASLAWLWTVEGVRPDRWDLTGATLCLIGAAIVLWGPRAAA